MHAHLARLKREAQLLASLNHPHIAAIYGLAESDGAHALVLELVEGETLAARIATGPLPIEEALSIAGQIAEALGAAHERGIVHRDLKPANVKLRDDGVVKVLDFGIAKSMAPRDDRDLSAPTLTAAALTAPGRMVGTPAYMAPEQVSGRSADKRCDIWAFGCVLFEMLTGRRAFEGCEVADVLAAVLTRAIPTGRYCRRSCHPRSARCCDAAWRAIHARASVISLRPCSCWRSSRR